MKNIKYQAGSYSGKPGIRIMLFLTLALLAGCSSGGKNKEPLPVLGEPEVVIGDFRFMNQDSAWVTNETFEDKIYIADFFFTSCPTICPVMKKQMLRVYKAYEGNPAVNFLSHTIDPRHDDVERLHDYAERLGVSSRQWHFVTGTKDSVYTIAEKSYLVPASEDKDAPGGFIHGGHFVLVDPDRHIRGVYDGTSEEEVDKLMDDIEVLLEEIKSI